MVGSWWVSGRNKISASHFFQDDKYTGTGTERLNFKRGLDFSHEHEKIDRRTDRRKETNAFQQILLCFQFRSIANDAIKISSCSSQPQREAYKKDRYRFKRIKAVVYCNENSSRRQTQNPYEKFTAVASIQ
jgi:hypothetical protein